MHVQYNIIISAFRGSAYAVCDHLRKCSLTVILVAFDLMWRGWPTDSKQGICRSRLRVGRFNLAGPEQDRRTVVTVV